MADAWDLFFVFVIGAFLSGALVFIVVETKWRDALIARDLVSYCPESGSFAFKGECEK
mgnify:FL=1